MYYPKLNVREERTMLCGSQTWCQAMTCLESTAFTTFQHTFLRCLQSVCHSNWVCVKLLCTATFMLEVISCWSGCWIVSQGQHQHVCTCEWLLEAVTDMTGVSNAVQGSIRMAGGYKRSQNSQWRVTENTVAIQKEPLHGQKVGVWGA
jgi:hypothetical protein